jgi:hypothetical protein
MTAHTENSLALDTSSQRVALRCGTNLASDTLGPAMGEPPPQTPLPRRRAEVGGGAVRRVAAVRANGASAVLERWFPARSPVRGRRRSLRPIYTVS